ncbi:serine protease easter-like [Zophobas morio]|uniref:serine protease easter-like n=1 Tax=Zophobas morio TaxID=2755281 RepID=UPI003082A515
MCCINKTVFFLYFLGFLQIWSHTASIVDKKDECVQLQSCPHVNEIIKTKKGTFAGTTLLTLLHCKFENNRIYVNCPDQKEVTKFMDSGELIPNYDSCGEENVEQRISGGEKTGIDDYPWIGLIKYRTKKGDVKHGCHGSLITNRYLLTAAHCVDPNRLNIDGLNLTSVVLGEYDVRNETDCLGDDCADPIQEIPVESYNMHPDYKLTTFANDIALIRMSREVEYTDFIKPICLPPKNLIAPFNQTLLIAGWGNTENNVMNPTKVQARFMLRRKETCRVNRNLTTKQFCAGSTHNAQTCPGDSGGPLMMRKKLDTQRLFLIGVYSLGVGCQFNTNTSIYSKVSSYIEWVVTTIHK